MVNIRPVTAADYSAIAGIYTLTRPEPVMAEELQTGDQRAQEVPTATFHRLVAADENGRVLGTGYAERMPWLPDGRWEVYACSHPDSRGRGVATALLEAAERIAREGGATALDSWCRSEPANCLEWAQRRGFASTLLRTESVLDLSHWDGSRFAGHIDRVTSTGIRFVTIDGPEAPDYLVRGIYDLEWATGPDVPDWDEGTNVVPYEDWKPQWSKYSGERFVALALDGDKVVGESTLHYHRLANRSGYTGYTGVLREYRGRGIALALKLVCIERAVAEGLPRMRTNNDFENPAMLAVNNKLGYQFVPGPHRLFKRL